jgi:outer membrane protein assembly factor BamA
MACKRPNPGHFKAFLGIALACLVAGGAHGHILPSLKARTPEHNGARPAGLPTDAELESAGARIGEIRYDARNLFDPGAADENTSLTRLANRLHMQTRAATIQDQLLFKSGDLYAAHLLEESARILRDTRYLREAIVRPVAFDGGVVDVEVTTQDVWTFNPGVSFGRKGGTNTSGFQIEDLNFLGTGTQLGFGLSSGIDRDSKEIYYRDRQLGSSWWDLKARYADNSDGRLAEFALERPFYALGSRWAAGISLVDDQRTDSRFDLGEVTDRYQVTEKRATIHFGHSRGLVGEWARRLIAGLTADQHQFGAASMPGAAPPGLLPADRKLVYPWIGAEWVQNDFRTARNRDQIEKTEDYSLGWRVRTSLGYASTAWGSDREAFMLAGSFSKGETLSERQSLEFAAHVSGRVEGGAIAGGLLDAEARYYFRQSPRRLFFMNLSAEAGSNLDLDQQILLGGDNGLRGYPLRYQSGDRRWLFTAEQRLFSNWYPFQLFNVGGAVFYDMGRTWGRDPLGAPSQGLLKDVGFGLRLGNSRSALGSVLHIDIAFPLDGDRSISNAQLLIDTKKSF